jgi:hypothetical protein
MMLPEYLTQRGENAGAPKCPLVKRFAGSVLIAAKGAGIGIGAIF